MKAATSLPSLEEEAHDPSHFANNSTFTFITLMKAPIGIGRIFMM